MLASMPSPSTTSSFRPDGTSGAIIVVPVASNQPAIKAHKNEILMEPARKGFEVAMYETDPLIMARLLVTGRDCVQQIQNKFNEATSAAWSRIVIVPNSDWG
jgi:hypothetical protein